MGPRTLRDGEVGSYEPVPGKEQAISTQAKAPSPSACSTPHQTSLTKQESKDNIVKNFKMTAGDY